MNSFLRGSIVALLCSTATIAGQDPAKKAPQRAGHARLPQKPWIPPGSREDAGFAKLVGSRPLQVPAERQKDWYTDGTNRWPGMGSQWLKGPSLANVVPSGIVGRASIPKTQPVPSRPKLPHIKPAVAVVKNTPVPPPTPTAGTKPPANTKPAIVQVSRQTPPPVAKPATKVAEVPAYLRELDGLLDRQTGLKNTFRSVSQTREPVTSQRHHTDASSVFDPISQAVAYDPSIDLTKVPVNDAASLMISDSAPNYYHTSVNTTPRPNRDVHPVNYNPLYFEELNLERCAQGYGCATTVVSAAHFFGTATMLPGLMLASPPHKCVQANQDCPACAQFPKDAKYQQ